VENRRPSGGLEHEVLAVLLAADEPMSAAQVRAAMGGTLAYTTVMTVLARIAEKGLALRERKGRAHAYTPIRNGAEVTAMKMRRLLDADDDRAAVLARFVGSLSDADEAILMEMLGTPGPDPTEEPDI
jgi:predicted transcriptional regulator